MSCIYSLSASGGQDVPRSKSALVIGGGKQADIDHKIPLQTNSRGRQIAELPAPTTPRCHSVFFVSAIEYDVGQKLLSDIQYSTKT